MTAFYANVAAPIAYDEGRAAFPLHLSDPQVGYAARSRMIPVRFCSPVAPYDPELPGIYEAHIMYTVEDLVQRLELDNWVAIANTTSLPLGKSWMEMGFFDRKAVVTAVNKYISNREKETNKKTQELKQAIEDKAGHRSAFDGVKLPGMFGT